MPTIRGLGKSEIHETAPLKSSFRKITLRTEGFAQPVDPVKRPRNQIPNPLSKESPCTSGRKVHGENIIIK